MAETAVEKKEPLFGKKERKLLTNPLDSDNPLTVQVLGICSALAVTTLTFKALVMAVAVIFVTGFAALITSLLRNSIPGQVRMIVQLVIIAFLVTMVELTLKAVSYPVYKDLSVFIGLIITNCIVMGRLEAFSLANKPWRSFLDGIGNGLGYGLILIIIGVIREIFGKGTLMAGSPFGSINIIGASNSSTEYLINTAADGSWFSWYTNNGLMVLPASSMFIIAIIIWVQRSWNKDLVDVS